MDARVVAADGKEVVVLWRLAVQLKFLALFWVSVNPSGDDFVRVRWDDGGRDLPLTPAKQFTLISRQA